MAATLLLGFAAQRHYLSHALAAIHAPTHDTALDGHAKACEQCLQFAAFHGAPPAVLAALPQATSQHAPVGVVAERALPARRFTAYVSRAPPLNG